ncbi:MAG: DUF6062 family protein [Clostridia bacterium]|nr:DUF6062 family protein [Clostridia bacterium]
MEKIYTIPVNEAYSSPCDCPICKLHSLSEQKYIEYYLGPSLMEPDTRILTNKTGFCQHHFGMLNKSDINRLGLGLILHTHLLNINDDLSKDLATAVPDKAGLFKGKNSDYKSKLISIADHIDSRVDMCPVCDKINDSMKHYVEVIFWMFKHDDSFKAKFADTKSYCLPHLALLLREASKLSQNDAADFLSVLTSNFYSSTSELIKDVEWFTLKFDYRNTDKPWGNSKNSIQRAMRFLSGDCKEFDEQGKK